MANKQAYLDSLEICQKAQDKATKIADAILKDKAEANSIVEDSIACFLEDAYYNGVPEKQEMALFELVYEKAVAKIEETKEEIHTEEPENLESVKNTDTIEEAMEVEETVGLVEDTDLTSTNESVVSNTDLPEDKSSEDSEKFEDKLPDETIDESFENEEDKYSEMKVEYDASETGALLENTEQDLSGLEDISEEKEPETSKKPSLFKRIIPGIIYVVLGLIIVWLIIGLLINSGKISPIDLGYSWFNNTFFRAFFLN